MRAQLDIKDSEITQKCMMVFHLLEEFNLRWKLTYFHTVNENWDKEDGKMSPDKRGGKKCWWTPSVSAKNIFSHISLSEQIILL